MTRDEFKPIFTRLSAAFRLTAVEPATFAVYLRSLEHLDAGLAGKAADLAISRAQFFPPPSAIVDAANEIERDRPRAPAGRVYRGDFLQDVYQALPGLATMLVEKALERKEKIRLPPPRERRTGDTGPVERTEEEARILRDWCELQEAVARYRAGASPRIPLFPRPCTDAEWRKAIDEFFPDAREVMDKFPPLSTERIECWRGIEQLRLQTGADGKPWSEPKTPGGKSKSEEIRKLIASGRIGKALAAVGAGT